MNLTICSLTPPVLAVSALWGTAVSSRLIPAGGGHVQQKSIGRARRMIGISKSIWFVKCTGTHAGCASLVSNAPQDSQETSTREPLTFSSPAPSRLLGVKKIALSNLEKPSL